MGVLSGELTRARRKVMVMYPNSLAENLHRLILDLDSNLGVCVDQGIRQRLVKAIYALRDLEQLVCTDNKDLKHHLDEKVIFSL
jgi:hypothetical protein